MAQQHSTPPASLADAALQILTEKLILLDIAPGQALSEQELGAELGIGRTPLREAIKRLEADRLVITYPRRGTFASPVDLTALVEVSEVRRTLEPLAARLAAQRRSPEDAAALREIRAELAALDPGTSARDLMRADMRAHRAVHRAAANTHLAHTLEQYSNLATRVWSVAAARLRDAHRHIVECVPLLDAVIDGDAAGAEHLMLEHIDEFDLQIRQVMAGSRPVG